MRTTKPFDTLALSLVEKRFNSIRKAAKDAKVKPGWIHYTRQAMGMTLKKLAERAGVSKATVAQAERSEQQSKATIATMKKMAEAMNCEFVYAFVPKANIKTVLREQALKKAKRILASADTHMTLEDQKVEEDMKDRIDRLADRLIERGDVW